MKKILTLFTIIILLNSCSQLKESLYCGKVTEKYLLHHKSHSTYCIVFYCEKINRKINVEVTPNTYVNANIGKEICFSLRKEQVE